MRTNHIRKPHKYPYEIRMNVNKYRVNAVISNNSQFTPVSMCNTSTTTTDFLPGDWANDQTHSELRFIVEIYNLGAI